MSFLIVFSFIDFSSKVYARTIKPYEEKMTETTTETTTETSIESSTQEITELSSETTTDSAMSSTETPILSEKEQTIQNIVDASPANNIKPIIPAERETLDENENATIHQKDVLFENGDYFWIRRYDFKVTKDGYYSSAFSIPGNQIEIRYLDFDTKTWAMTSDITKAPKNTLYINTEKYSLMLSVPGVYKKEFKNNTLEILRDKESPVIISKGNDEYIINFKFPQDENAIGEIWALQSSNKLVDWNDSRNFEALKSHDLGIERRWSWEGYYFPPPSNYVPTGENMLYRHPANYTGSSWAKHGGNLIAEDLGYIMTKTCMQNQNADGYWETGPKSLWLESDFNIKENFYDTRFNTDFAISLIYAYNRYNNKEFLKSAVRYGEFLTEYAANHHYEANNGGWLVEDYAGSNADYKRNHVSLNHQLNEMNFLYDLYNATNEQKYYDTAELMLLGIENTRDQWVLKDNNLNYAVMYTGINNTMIDYPYLTYNDLFATKQILNKYFNKTSETIEYLMSCKKIWMDNNNITTYLK